MADHIRSEVEYFLCLSLEEDQSIQGLTDHLSLTLQSCKTVSSLIDDFCNQIQKPWETEDAFAGKLQGSV